MFEKHFSLFSEGLREMLQTFWSVGQSMFAPWQANIDSPEEFEQLFARLLALVEYFSEYEGEEGQPDWRGQEVAAKAAGLLAENASCPYLSMGRGCTLRMANGVCKYQGNSGLAYGWSGDARDGWTFWVIHPSHASPSPNSSLRQAAEAAGWEESEALISERLPVVDYF